MARFECKYYLNETQYDQVMRWIEPYIEPDPFARPYPGYRYMLSSLYLDSPDLKIGRMTIQGRRNRFKLRIRSYNDDPSTPIFFEIKRRIDGVIDKTRIKLRREDGFGLMDGYLTPGGVALDAEARHDLDTFMRLTESFGAGPMMRVRYEREAYQATYGEPVRITFDRQLAYAHTPTTDFTVYGSGWNFLKTEGVVLEIKFPDYFPFWVNELICGLQLQRVSIAKYIMSLTDAHDYDLPRRLLLEGI